MGGRSTLSEGGFVLFPAWFGRFGLLPRTCVHTCVASVTRSPSCDCDCDCDCDVAVTVL